MIIKNKKAFFDYSILEKYEAGIALKGSEVKSIRNGKASLKESYVRYQKGELFVVNMHVTPYALTSDAALEPQRSRKLLLHKAQIQKLLGNISQKGYTIVPLSLYFKKGKAKLEIAVCQGKRKHDKRQSIKKKEHQREMSRVLRRK
ncbi:MAG: SsrA-binding protein SmpB [Candidatus Omnitrophica bacterium]|nr:SsrA-binding protein SmpB [Candidatus Omnitrophota bacterium]